ncbi:MAG: leucine-rich repeat domain-containing protein [Haliscomenobacter sp.]|nr:leucine-rich repeat domain-containing protein [Haliscomenobacter sp.]
MKSATSAFWKSSASLTSLNLSSNQISDIRWLEKLSQLQTLYLSDNQISDIAPLIELVKKGIPITIEQHRSESTSTTTP